MGYTCPDCKFFHPGSCPKEEHELVEPTWRVLPYLECKKCKGAAHMIDLLALCPVKEIKKKD